MERHFVYLCISVVFINCVFGIYTREELTTKPPFTKKIWRRIALQPSELNTHTLENTQNSQHFENSQITLHHNYSRVQVHGSTNDQKQNPNQGQTMVITETIQTKTHTFPPEGGITDQEQFTSEVEPIWTKPERYEGQNVDQIPINHEEQLQHRTPKGHYIIREQITSSNQPQSATESSEVKVHDKLMRLEQTDTNYQQPSYTIHSRPNEPPRDNFGTSSSQFNAEQISTSSDKYHQISGTNQEQTGTNYEAPRYTIHSRPNEPKRNNFGTSFHHSSQSRTNQEQFGTNSGRQYQQPNYNNFGTSSSQFNTNQEQTDKHHQISSTNQEQTRTNYEAPSYTIHSRPNEPRRNNFGTTSIQSSTNQEQFSQGNDYGTSSSQSNTNQEHTRTSYHAPRYNLHSRPNENAQNNFQSTNQHKPIYKLEYRPAQSTYTTNTKSYSNMAFENCPKNATGPVAYLWSCSQFLNCWKGRGIVQNCAPGTKFNPETLECDYAHKVNCISGAHDQKVKSEKYTEQQICSPNFSGLLPHPKDCTKFVNCAFGQSFVQDCGPGTAFNSVIQACDYPHKVGCEIEINADTNNYELEEKDIRASVNTHLGYGFQSGTTDDYNQYVDQNTDGSTVIRVFDHNLVRQEKQFGQNFNQEPGQNTQQSGINYNQHSTQNCGQNNCQSGQTNQGQFGQNCGPNNCPPSQPIGTDYNQQFPQNTGGPSSQSSQTSQGQFGQSCGPNNCPPPQPIGTNYNQQFSQNTDGQTGQTGQTSQTTQAQFGQKCGPNNCVPSQPIGTNYNQQFPQNTGGQTGQTGQTTQGQSGQNCGPNSCPPSQQIGTNYNQQFPQNTGGQTGQTSQTSQGQAGQNCGPNNCRPPQPIGQNCDPRNTNCQGQTNLAHGQNIRAQSHTSTSWIGQSHDRQNSGQANQDYGSRAHSVQYPSNFGQNGSNPGQNTGRYSQTTTTSTSGQNYGYGQRNTTGQNVQYGTGGSKPEVKCPKGHSGLLPHPYICEKFLNCANGLTYIQDCGPGTVFNPISKVCDWPYNVKCSTSTIDDKRDTTTSTREHFGQNIGPSTGQYEGHTTQRNTTRYGQNIGTTYGQNTGQYHGQTAGQIQGQNTHGTSSGYGQNTGQYYGQTTQRNTSIYGQNTGQNHGQNTHSTSSGYGQNIDQQNYGQNVGQYHGQTTQRNTTSYGQNTDQHHGQTTHSASSEYGQNIDQQNYGQNAGQYYGQTTQRNTSRYGQTIGQNQGQTTHSTSSGYGQNLDQQNYGQTTQQNTSRYGQNTGQTQGQTTHSTSSSYGQNSGQYHGQNTGTTATQTNIHSEGQNYDQKPIQTTGTADQNRGYDQHYSGNQQYNRTGYLGQNTGYRRVIGYRRDPVYNYNQTSTTNQNSWYQKPTTGYNITTTTQQGYHPGYKPTSSDNIRPIYFRNYTTEHENRNTHQIIEPSAPTILNYTLNVQESTRKTGKHWPAPFPSTDTSADYYFEEVTEASNNINRKVWKNSPKCNEGEFECSFNECIPEIWHCDGEEDCRDGSDEKNCKMHLRKFTTIPNSRLYKHEVEKWLNTDLQTCANYCLNSKSFGCRSFNFRKDENVCLLCDTNVGLSGALANSHLYDYYEISAYSVNCSNMYKCSNGKCINYTQICDGNDDCGNRQDEKNCSAESIGYEIKLRGSQFKNEGRIEVKVFNEWGYICDDKFGLRNADVVCKELGFHEGALEIKASSFFSRDVKDNETYYLMDDVQCIGNETSIRNCDFNGWGIHNCMPQEIVGIVCKTPEEVCPMDHWKCDTTKECLPIQFVCDGVFDCEDRSDEGIQHCEAPIELRLVNGTSKNEGRVEIRYHGIWGTICDDDFNDMTAKIVCKSLGFQGSAVAKKDGAFGSGIGPIWLDQVNCVGNESLIEDCAHWNWGEHNCEHSEDAGVVCSHLDTSQFEKKSKDGNIAHITPIKPNIDETIFKGKCGFRGDDLFTDEDNENSEIHFRVVKGSLARKGDYPWQATIRVKGKLKSTHWCGAVVISNKYVLTAAHCLVGFAKGSYIVRAGDYNVNEEEGTEVEAFIEDFFVHERFRQGGHMNNDIALIKLKGQGLKLSKQVQPICLPDKDAKYRPGLNCTISGFGSTETGKSTSSHQLQAGWVKLQSEETCKMPQVYGDAITPGMFCAGSLDEGVDSCDGDSGGPLACLDKGLFTLYGITSWGQRCGHVNKPGVYVKVSEYRDWIDRNIEESNY